MAKDNSANQFPVTGSIPSGLFLVTAAADGKRDGFLASWVQQASFEPLLISLAIKPGRPVYDHIVQGKTFVVHVVGQKNNGVMKPFWGAYNPEKDPFENISVQEEDSLVLLPDCLGAIVCRLEKHVVGGDHDLILARVEKEFSFSSADKPLSHIRSSALNY